MNIPRQRRLPYRPMESQLTDTTPHGIIAIVWVPGPKGGGGGGRHPLSASVRLEGEQLLPEDGGGAHTDLGG